MSAMSPYHNIEGMESHDYSVVAVELEEKGRAAMARPLAFPFPSDPLTASRASTPRARRRGRRLARRPRPRSRG